MNYISAHELALRRFEHLERIMLGIGTLQLGVISFAATLIFDLDPPDAVTTQPAPKSDLVLFYWLTIALLSVASIGFLHTGRLCMGTGLYAVRLELRFADDRRLRPLAQIGGNSLPRLKQDARLRATTILNPAFVPIAGVSIPIIAIWAFAGPCGIDQVARSLVSIILVGFALAYGYPRFLRFEQLVVRARRFRGRPHSTAQEHMSLVGARTPNESSQSGLVPGTRLPADRDACPGSANSTE